MKGFVDLFDHIHPHCTEAEGDAPMEDSGGPYGFAEIMDILNLPDHPESKDTQKKPHLSIKFARHDPLLQWFR